MYTVNFDEKYLGLVGWSVGMQNSTSDAYQSVLVDDSFVDGGEGIHASVNDRDGYAQLQIVQADGTGAATMCNGMALWFSFDLKTSEQG
jgi:hypothetical protein